MYLIYEKCWLNIRSAISIYISRTIAVVTSVQAPVLELVREEQQEKELVPSVSTHQRKTGRSNQRMDHPAESNDLDLDERTSFLPADENVVRH